MSKEITLLILAAGMASRYGKLKQVEGFGPNNESLMEYSIYDAIRAGFNKVVFVIRKEFAADFEPIINKKLSGKIETAYVYQSYDLSKYGISEKVERKKPWGTAHAIMEAEPLIDTPFCMINADDFYGYSAYQAMHDFLTSEVSEQLFSLVAYKLKNTLSEKGHVSRGVCKLSSQGYLSDITEMLKVQRDEQGNIFDESEKGIIPIAQDSPVSMNFFGFHPILFQVLKAEFKPFFDANKTNPSAEYLIPMVVKSMIHRGLIKMRALSSENQWFGVTYPDDGARVRTAIHGLVEQGHYPENLWI